MAVDLRSLKPAKGAVRERKRLGRGVGSGLGKTSGKGHKGALARSGGAVSPGFEGGQMPLQRRLPKRGFRNARHKEYAVVSLTRLDHFPAGSVVDAEALRRAGIVRGRGPVKILSDGEITKALTVKVQAFSAKAREKLVAAGGTAELVARASA